MSAPELLAMYEKDSFMKQYVPIIKEKERYPLILGKKNWSRRFVSKFKVVNLVRKFLNPVHNFVNQTVFYPEIYTNLKLWSIFEAILLNF